MMSYVSGAQVGSGGIRLEPGTSIRPPDVPNVPGIFTKFLQIFFLVVPLRDYHGSAPPRQEEGKTENQPPISNRERMYQNICYGILIRIRRVFHVSFFDLF